MLRRALLPEWGSTHTTHNLSHVTTPDEDEGSTTGANFTPNQMRISRTLKQLEAGNKSIAIASVEQQKEPSISREGVKIGSLHDLLKIQLTVGTFENCHYM